MINIVIASIVVVQCTTGTLSQFSEAATSRVISNRSVAGRTAYDLPEDWREYDGLIAVESCDRLGEVVTVYWRGHHATMLVFDCSGHASTSAWMKRNNIIGEVSYNIARDWGSIGRGMRGAVMCKQFENRNIP